MQDVQQNMQTWAAEKTEENWKAMNKAYATYAKPEHQVVNVDPFEGEGGRVPLKFFQIS